MLELDADEEELAAELDDAALELEAAELDDAALELGAADEELEAPPDNTSGVGSVGPPEQPTRPALVATNAPPDNASRNSRRR